MIKEFKAFSERVWGNPQFLLLSGYAKLLYLFLYTLAKPQFNGLVCHRNMDAISEKELSDLSGFRLKRLKKYIEELMAKQLVSYNSNNILQINNYAYFVWGKED